ncbi:hypothetical protein COLO4_35621 [Corchorus olitorius]|uniref:Uncharacterized protein n=1 Tax=Corchorus olitorius TaxID=93759 RepID=A0A1R3GEL8_9ROSI|nr:hypothetical protein COLO4_35621 [Corchorus olitorius]
MDLVKKFLLHRIDPRFRIPTFPNLQTLKKIEEQGDEEKSSDGD